MAGKTTNWESTETWQRVVASIIASGVKLDLRTIALYYGTTYDTLENRFRKIKKDGALLKEEIESGKRAEVPSRGKSAPTTPRKPKTPMKEALNSVANGRVCKTSPTKKKAVKKGQAGSNASSIFDDVSDGNMGSFSEGALGSFDAETAGMFGGGMDFDD